jgi:hypothetical protein
MRLLKTLAFAAAALSVAFSAHAVTFSFAPGSDTPGSGYSPTTGFVVIDDFNQLSDLSPFSGSGFGLLGPGSDPSGADPAFPTTNNTTYLSVLGGGSATANFVNPYSGSFQFDWGSIDTYNTLTIHRTSGIDFVINGGLFPPANGDQGASATNGVFTVNAAGDFLTGFTLTSGQNSFEIDNFAVRGGINPLTGGGVPEPATWAFMIMGFGGAGSVLRRRRSVLAAI